MEGLSASQAEACTSVAGLTPLQLIVGPAGTGKTTALAPAVDELQAQGRVVFGVASTAAAAEVLATETTMTAGTLDKLLYEHTRPDRSPGPVFDLPPGSTVIVDEAGTVSTPKLAALARLAEQRAWRVVLVGDPRQFSAVGRGGMFAHLIDTYGAIELDQVHRFANRWEREASLRLRNGDPGVFVEYDRRGRLHNGTHADMETEILDAWLEGRRRGESVALMANTVDTVTRLNQAAQQTRIRNGELNPNTPRLTVGEQRLLVGDEVVTRRNDRTLRTDQRVMVNNRDHWTINTIHPDRSVTARRPHRHRSSTRRLRFRPCRVGLRPDQPRHPRPHRRHRPPRPRRTDRYPRRLHPDDPRPQRQPRLRRHRRRPHRRRGAHPGRHPGLDRPTRHHQTHRTPDPPPRIAPVAITTNPPTPRARREPSTRTGTRNQPHRHCR